MIKARDVRGQGLVEFAIVLPIIIVMIFGIIDLGRAVFTYNTLAQSARQAVRTAMVDQDVSRVRSTAFASAPTLSLAAGNVDVCFKEANTSADDCTSSTDDCPAAQRVIGCLAIVTTHVNYVPMTPVIGSLIGTVAISSTSVQAIEYVCPYDTVTTCP